MPKIPPRPGVEVFFNEAGNISLKQIPTDPYDDDAIVVVHPEDVDALIGMLKEVQAEARIELAEHARSQKPAPTVTNDPDPEVPPLRPPQGRPS